MTIRDMTARAESKPNLTAAELALLTGFAVETIRRMGRRGALPTIHAGRAVRFPREECIAAMRRQRAHPDATTDDSRRLLTPETADV